MDALHVSCSFPSIRGPPIIEQQVDGHLFSGLGLATHLDWAIKIRVTSMQVAYSSAKQLRPTGRMFKSIQIASDQVGEKGKNCGHFSRFRSFE